MLVTWPILKPWSRHELALSAIGGWFPAMFGVVFCPAIGFKGDRRWM
jgi:hypothetical protein